MIILIVVILGLRSRSNENTKPTMPMTTTIERKAAARASEVASVQNQLD